MIMIESAPEASDWIPDSKDFLSDFLKATMFYSVHQHLYDPGAGAMPFVLMQLYSLKKKR